MSHSWIDWALRIAVLVVCGLFVWSIGKWLWEILV